MKKRTVIGAAAIELGVTRGGLGCGRPIVFMHGWAQNGLAWGHQLKITLAEEFELVALDLLELTQLARDAVAGVVRT